MPREPFAALTRRARVHAAVRRLQRRLARPVRPSRIDTGRSGPDNLLLVGVDTLRADHVGCLGCPQPTTPRLDALAAAGTVFTDVTAPAPWTLPSFASALTGVMPGLHGAYLAGGIRNMDVQVPRPLAPEATSLPAHLGERGYRTVAFYSNQFFAFGLAESFDEHHYLNLPAEEVAATAREWIRRHADRPFFCFVLLNDPHEPTTPPWADLAPFLTAARARGADDDPASLARLARWGEAPLPHLGREPLPASTACQAALAAKKAIYAATVRQVDRAIGGLQDELVNRGLADRTLVSVFSDHGEEFRDHAEAALRWQHDPRGLAGIGHGHSHFQEVLHVPWMAWGPGVPVGSRLRHPVSLCDLAPTVTGWLGLPPPVGPGAAASRGWDQALRGRAQPADDTGARLILSEAIAYGPDLVALRRGHWKLVAHRDGRCLGLFDLEMDPGETTDLAAERPAEAAALQEDLDRWRQSGAGAVGDDDAGGWEDMDATVRQRLKDLGYAE